MLFQPGALWVCLLTDFMVFFFVSCGVGPCGVLAYCWHCLSRFDVVSEVVLFWFNPVAFGCEITENMTLTD